MSTHARSEFMSIFLQFKNLRFHGHSSPIAPIQGRPGLDFGLPLSSRPNERGHKANRKKAPRPRPSQVTHQIAAMTDTGPDRRSKARSIGGATNTSARDTTQNSTARERAGQCERHENKNNHKHENNRKDRTRERDGNAGEKLCCEGIRE